MNKTIYIADDEKNIRDLLQTFLEQEGFAVQSFANGDALLNAFEAAEPDLVILDVMMPGIDGFVACANIRNKSDVPIILLTARGSDADYITGFTLGADDYFTKPFSPIKLTMRVKALFKRLDKEECMVDKKELRFADIVICPRQKTAFCNEKEIRFTNTEYAVLSYILQHQEKAISREELLNEIWGYDQAVETRVTDDIIKRVRKKLALAESRASIETIWGFGFKLSENTEP